MPTCCWDTSIPKRRSQADVRLDLDAARTAVGALGRQLQLGALETAAGIVRVADEEMLRALRVATVERGVDPRDYAVVAFGGAGPMHAARLAEQLGVERVLCPPASGVLSALGLATADRRRDAGRSVLMAEEDLAAGRAREAVRELAAAARAEMPHARIESHYAMRYRGQSFELEVAAGPDAEVGELRELFEQAHERRYGYRDSDSPVELVTVRVSATEERPSAAGDRSPPGRLERTTRIAVFDGREQETAVLRGRAVPGERCRGPAVWELPESTAVIPPGWARPRRRARRAGPRARSGQMSLDPVTLQVLLGGMRALCEEMGAVLVRSAHSANIKERRDASTALFDGAGAMVMQAEHIPVHLGAMPDAVAAVLGEDHRPGDVWMLNDPYRGGTHLPDITAVSPLFLDGRHAGFAASRAHHADVGGDVPGSMPAASTRLDEEGVVIPPTRVARDWETDGRLLGDLVSRMRGPRQREADLRAQLAANRLAARRLEQLAGRHGADLLSSAMAEVLDYAERRTRNAIARIPDGSYAAEDVLEDDGRGVARDLAGALLGDRRRRRPGGRLLGHRASDGGQPQLPALGHEVRRVLRAAGADRPGHPSQRRRLSPGVGRGAGRVARERARTRRRGGWQRGDVEPHRGRRDAGAGRGRRGAGVRPGNDEQRDARQRGVHLLRDDSGAAREHARTLRGPAAVHVAMSNTLNTPIEALETEFPLRVDRVLDPAGLGWRGAAQRR